MPEVTDPNCNAWSTVDFGKGPVEIRCTQTGEHTDHMCVIVLVPEEDLGGEEFPLNEQGTPEVETKGEVRDFPCCDPE